MKDGTFAVGANVALVNGDVCITSRTNIGQGYGLVSNASRLEGRGSDVLIEAPASGTTILGAGRFPSKPLIIRSKLPEDTIYNKDQVAVKNDTAFLLDDGKGNLLQGGAVKGSIVYETGEFKLWDCPMHAEFHAFASHVSSQSGGQTSTASESNVITAIKARSVNAKANTKINISIVG